MDVSELELDYLCSRMREVKTIGSTAFARMSELDGRELWAAAENKDTESIKCKMKARMDTFNYQSSLIPLASAPFLRS